MGAWHTKCPDKTPIRMPRPDRPYSQPQTTAKPKLLDQVRGVLRRKHYSIRTEQSYVDWIKRFIFELPDKNCAVFVTQLACLKLFVP